MLHNVGNNRDCDIYVDHRNNTNRFSDAGYFCAIELGLDRQMDA